eukprot:TRINITY_DN8640_c0_g1_i2.p1 TRINITY_DN8640_c0_g1~~TRINITY_DN8640_c0_g1_i2.p1  ORF type:complete len:323 (+),score=46.32 TRINITY_DN8640_c0_g1_i2:43-969(+)
MCIRDRFMIHMWWVGCLLIELQKSFSFLKKSYQGFKIHRQMISNLMHTFPLVPKEQLSPDDFCSICQDQLIVARKLRCEHRFHGKCLYYWVKNQSNTCPICRAVASDVNFSANNAPNNNNNLNGLRNNNNNNNFNLNNIINNANANANANNNANANINNNINNNNNQRANNNNNNNNNNNPNNLDSLFHGMNPGQGGFHDMHMFQGLNNPFLTQTHHQTMIELKFLTWQLNHLSIKPSINEPTEFNFVFNQTLSVLNVKLFLECWHSSFAYLSIFNISYCAQSLLAIWMSRLNSHLPCEFMCVSVMQT